MSCSRAELYVSCEGIVDGSGSMRSSEVQRDGPMGGRGSVSPLSGSRMAERCGDVYGGMSPVTALQSVLLLRTSRAQPLPSVRQPAKLISLASQLSMACMSSRAVRHWNSGRNIHRPDNLKV